MQMAVMAIRGWIKDGRISKSFHNLSLYQCTKIDVCITKCTFPLKDWAKSCTIRFHRNTENTTKFVGNSSWNWPSALLFCSHSNSKIPHLPLPPTALIFPPPSPSSLPDSHISNTVVKELHKTGGSEMPVSPLPGTGWSTQFGLAEMEIRWRWHLRNWLLGWEELRNCWAMRMC